MKKLILAMPFVLMMSPAWSMDGNLLHKNCTSSQDIQRMACFGYIRGVIEGLFVSAAITKKSLFCPPDQFNYEQGEDIVRKYLSEHPEDRHENGAAIVMVALKIVWPCNN